MMSERAQREPEPEVMMSTGEPSAELIGNGDLVRCQVPPSPGGRDDASPAYHYGIVIRTTFPMRDDPKWSDHLILWNTPAMKTLEWWWCGHIELVSQVEEP